MTIDTSIAFGGRWWGEGSGIRGGAGLDIASPLDVENRRLIRLASFLAPSMLRIGGTEADRLKYWAKKKGKKKRSRQSGGTGFPDEKGPSSEPLIDLVLKRRLWKRVNAFARKAGFTILFTINAGPASRDEKGAWKSGQARKLIAYSVKKSFPVAAWELGNEVNGFPFVHGLRHRVGASRYIRDFGVFSQLIRKIHPEARAVGPASAVWPLIGEPGRILSALGSSSEAGPGDVISWHYYPQQSSRGGFASRRASGRTLLSPRRLDTVLRYCRKIRSAAGGREVWVTESGHALYGGEPGLSDTCASTTWWLDELGILAREGVARVFRQTLAGGDYGLLRGEDFEPRPDFYASFLWKKLMGGRALPAPRIEGPDAKFRAYVHAAAGYGKYTLLLINLADKPAFVSAPGRLRERYVLSPAGGFAAKEILLNGEPVAEDLLYAWGKKKTRRKYGITPAPAGGADCSATLPPYACAFLVLKT